MAKFMKFTQLDRFHRRCGREQPGGLAGFTECEHAVVLFSSSPLLCGRMESLEPLRRSVPAHHACAQAISASGATKRRGALPTPGRESRLPGVLLVTGPGLWALLWYWCSHATVFVAFGDFLPLPEVLWTESSAAKHWLSWGENTICFV